MLRFEGSVTPTSGKGGDRSAFRVMVELGGASGPGDEDEVEENPGGAPGWVLGVRSTVSTAGKGGSVSPRMIVCERCGKDCMGRMDDTASVELDGDV